MDKIVLVGGGGHCKVIIDIIRSNYELDIEGIVDIRRKEEYVLDIPVIGTDDDLKRLYNCGVHNAFVCVGDLKIRERVYNNLKKIGFKLPVLVHESSIISPYTKIKDGTCIMAGAIINPGAVINENCIINSGAVIEHDCTIGRNTHISPNVAIAGGVTIGENCHIGIGSSVIPGIRIGSNVVIGAGAVVIGNIPDDTLAVGVPAKIKK